MKLFHFTRRKALKKRNELLRARINKGTPDLYTKALKFLKDKNISTELDREYIARWMTEFALHHYTPSVEDDKLKLQINVLDEILN